MYFDMSKSSQAIWLHWELGDCSLALFHKLQRWQFVHKTISPHLRSNLLFLNRKSSQTLLTSQWCEIRFHLNGDSFYFFVTISVELGSYFLRSILALLLFYSFSFWRQAIWEHSIAVKAISKFRQTHLSNSTGRTIRKTLRWKFYISLLFYV